MEVINSKLPFLGVASSLIGGRSENQDTYMASDTPDGYLAVVCDGMGGGPGGKTASSIAAATIVDFILNRRDLSEGATAASNHKELLSMAVEAANTALRNKIREVPELNGMGTTATVVLASPECATMAHVGDSRIYQLRNNKIAFRTSDHSKVGEMVAMGTLTEEQARLSAYSNIITRALGIADSVEVEIDVRPYEKGDRFILCTDGIWGSMPQPELVRLLTRGPKSLQGTIDNLNLLVEKVGREKGGHHDNYTIILFETKQNSTMKEPLSKTTRLLIYALGGLCAISILLNIIFFCLPSKGQVTKELNETKEQLKQSKNTIDSLRSIVSSPKALTAAPVVEQVKNEPSVEQPKTKTDKETAKTTAEKIQNMSDSIAKSEQTKKIDELISNLNTLKENIISLGKMPIGNSTKVEKKKNKRTDYQGTIKWICNTYASVLTEENRKVLNNISDRLNDEVTIHQPYDDDKKQIKGSSPHCNLLAKDIEKLIAELKSRK